MTTLSARTDTKGFTTLRSEHVYSLQKGKHADPAAALHQADAHLQRVNVYVSSKWGVLKSKHSARREDRGAYQDVSAASACATVCVRARASALVRGARTCRHTARRSRCTSSRSAVSPFSSLKIAFLPFLYSVRIIEAILRISC